MNLNQSKIVCFLGVLLAASIGGTIRYQIVQQDLLWLDELHTSWVTSDSFGAIVPRAEQGNQSPLYFWLVWPIVQQLGQTAFAIRCLSLVCGVVTLILTAYLAWSWTRSAMAAFVVAWLISLDPGFVFYGTEARPYAMLQLLSVVQVFLFWILMTRLHLEDDSHRDDRRPSSPISVIGIAIITGMVSAAIINCHYTGVWLIGAEIFFLLSYICIAWAGGVRSFQIYSALVTFSFMALGVTLLCIPAGLHLIQVMERRENWAAMSSAAGLLFQLRWPFLLSIVLPSFCAAVFYFPNKEKIDSRLFDLKMMDRFAVKVPFVLLWATFPIISVLLLDFFGFAPLAMQRYTLVGAAAVPLFAGLCVGVSGKWYGQIAIAAVLVASSFVMSYQNGSIVYNPFYAEFLATRTLPMLRLENWKDPVDEINRRTDKKTQPVFLFSNLIEDVHAFATEDPVFLEYLLFPIRGIHTVDVTERIAVAAPTLAGQHFRPTDIELMKQHGGAWLIIRSSDPQLVSLICDELRGLAVMMAEFEKENNPQLKQNPIEPSLPVAQFVRFPMSHMPAQNVFLSDVILVSIDW